MAEHPAACRPELYRGVPCHRLGLPNGDSVLVAEHGAHVLSWYAQGREQLYLSPASLFDGRAPIRGGVPICFPQFNMRGNLPKHGFARNLRWQPQASVAAEAESQLVLRLQSCAATRSCWPADFDLALTVRLRPSCLQLTLDLRNTGAQAFEFTGALHTYLRVNDISRVELQGLDGQAEWDALTDRTAVAAASLRFGGEFDRVYAAACRSLLLCEGSNQRKIEQSDSFAHTVVWNPGGDRCAALPDMPPEGWRHMLCVEAAQVMQPLRLMPGEVWQG